MNLNEETKKRLDILAARSSFKGLSAYYMKNAIEQLMNEGVYCDEFLDVTNHSDNDSRGEVKPKFERALKAINVSVPNYEEAVWIILRYHISRIANKEVNALVGLKEIISEIYWEYNFHGKTKKYLGDSHGIEHLIGIYWWDYEPLEGELIKPVTEAELVKKNGKEKVDNLKSMIIEASEKWLSKFTVQDIEQ